MATLKRTSVSFERALDLGWAYQGYCSQCGERAISQAGTAFHSRARRAMFLPDGRIIEDASQRCRGAPAFVAMDWSDPRLPESARKL